MNKVTFKSRKEVTEFLKEKGIDVSNWTEEKWQSINKGQAEIHMMALAEAIWDSYNESTPKQLNYGEWHIPFGDYIETDKVEDLLHGPYAASYVRKEGDLFQAKIEIAVARCARLSYMTFENEIDYKKDIELHNHLFKSKHMSPFEHIVRAMTHEEYISFVKGSFSIDDIDSPEPDTIYISGETPADSLGWCDNFHGFISYRYMIEKGISI